MTNQPRLWMTRVVNSTDYDRVSCGVPRPNSRQQECACFDTPTLCAACLQMASCATGVQVGRQWNRKRHFYSVTWVPRRTVHKPVSSCNVQQSMLHDHQALTQVLVFRTRLANATSWVFHHARVEQRNNKRTRMTRGIPQGSPTSKCLLDTGLWLSLIHI